MPVYGHADAAPLDGLVLPRRLVDAGLDIGWIWRERRYLVEHSPLVRGEMLKVGDLVRHVLFAQGPIVAVTLEVGVPDLLVAWQVLERGEQLLTDGEVELVVGQDTGPAYRRCRGR